MTSNASRTSGTRPALLAFLAIFVSLGVRAASADERERPNVLFIAVDDLNHWVGHLGRNVQTKTPAIDRLASTGVSFTNAHCVATACNPSRAALLSGRRPSTTGIYQNRDDWRGRIPREETLVTLFRRHGYVTLGTGKIYHGGLDRDEEFHVYHRSSAPPPAKALAQGRAGAIRWAELEGGDEVLRDHHVVSWACEQLEKDHEAPFFLACGIYRPHLPWNVPKEYFDRFPLESIELPPYLAADLEDIPAAGRRMSGGKDHATILAKDAWKLAVRAYLASVAFADAQVGRLLDALEKGPHTKDTIVVLWGDHGWHLGEKDHWRKFALWEEATRAPLVWRVPGVTPSGGVCRRAVDFLTIYPTLADLCGLPAPAHLEGRSLRTLLAKPDAPWTGHAVTTMGRGNHAVRTDAWRLIRYANGELELYDEREDPYEWRNLAALPEHAATIAELAHLLPATDAEPPPAKE